MCEEKFSSLVIYHFGIFLRRVIVYNSYPPQNSFGEKCELLQFRKAARDK